jgi:plasmid stabilization system protein ParE
MLYRDLTNIRSWAAPGTMYVRDCVLFFQGLTSLFYRVVEHRAEIVRVLDGRRDIDEIFGGAT